MSKSPAARRAEKLRRSGFDLSYTPRNSGAVHVRCSQCEAMAINGVACHETGCPNQRR